MTAERKKLLMMSSVSLCRQTYCICFDGRVLVVLPERMMSDTALEGKAKDTDGKPSASSFGPKTEKSTDGVNGNCCCDRPKTNTKRSKGKTR